ncbi:hypothetical protein ACFX12_016842 [Malus domestica]
MDRTLPAFAVADGGVVTTFDMTTKYFMDVAVEGELWRLKDSNGKSPGLIGIKPESAVTFIDNHDTWSQNYCLSHLIKSCLDMLTLSPILAPQA